MSRHHRDEEPVDARWRSMLRDEGGNIASLRRLMRDLQDHLEDEPDLVRHPGFGNALINLGVNKILDDEGPKRTAAILLRMADAVSSGVKPKGTLAVRLSDTDA